jgi:zinc transport system ATP-binding protein
MATAVEIIDLNVMLGDFRALEDLNLSVDAGDFVAVIGPNGAGKSTLIKAILGLIPNYTGEIRIFGKDIRESNVEWIGYVPQLKTVDRSFPAATCDLVASGMKGRWPGHLSKADHDRVMEALELVSAGHLCHKPLGYLSGGEIQRVYLARAIVRKPRLLLLDEPATGIDAVGEDDMYNILDGYLEHAETTVMMVTHDWLTAQHHASRVLLLNRKLIAYGPHADVLSEDKLRAAFGHLGHHHHLHGEEIP